MASIVHNKAWPRQAVEPVEGRPSLERVVGEQVVFTCKSRPSGNDNVGHGQHLQKQRPALPC